MPRNPRQGEALVVRVPAAGTEAPTATFRGQNYAFFRSGSEWMALLPIVPDTPPGGHTVTVLVSRGGEQRQFKHVAEVQPVRFPVQHLRMSKQTSSLYNYPGVEKEDAAVRGAVRTRTDVKLWQGDWQLPVRGRQSTAYGVQRLRNGKPVGRHRGLDIAAPTGTLVKAPAAGRVVLAKGYKKHGNTVVLDHGQGLTSLYIHLHRISVKEGQMVKLGDTLGQVGSTGVSTGPHLHWSVYVHGEALEPAFFTRLTQRGVSF